MKCKQVTSIGNILFTTQWFIVSDLLHRYEKVSATLSEVKTPMIIFYNCIDTGQGMDSEAFPGSMYWTSQCGATEDMVNMQVSDIQSSRVDFVITVGDSEDSYAWLAFLNS